MKKLQKSVSKKFSKRFILQSDRASHQNESIQNSAMFVEIDSVHNWQKKQLEGLTENINDGVSAQECVSILSGFKESMFKKGKNAKPQNSARAVLAMQAGLKLLGKSVGKIDALWGGKTATALKEFQKEVFPNDPKECDGIPGPKTMTKLIEALEKKVLDIDDLGKSKNNHKIIPDLNLREIDKLRVKKNKLLSFLSEPVSSQEPASNPLGLKNGSTDLGHDKEKFLNSISKKNKPSKKEEGGISSLSGESIAFDIESVYTWEKNQLKGLTENISDGVSAQECVSILSGFKESMFKKGKNAKPQDSARAVLAMQAGLKLLGKSVGKIDALWGGKTATALKEFQKEAFQNDPKEWDGIPGPKTMGKLIKALSKIGNENPDQDSVEEEVTNEIIDPKKDYSNENLSDLISEDTKFSDLPKDVQDDISTFVKDIEKQGSSTINDTETFYKVFTKEYSAVLGTTGIDAIDLATIFGFGWEDVRMKTAPGTGMSAYLGKHLCTKLEKNIMAKFLKKIPTWKIPPQKKDNFTSSTDNLHGGVWPFPN